MSSSLLTAFWMKPTAREVEVWGQFPFENDQSGLPAQPIAQPYDLVSVSRALFRGQDEQRSVSGWREGSIAMSPLVVRTLIRLVERFRMIKHYVHTLVKANKQEHAKTRQRDYPQR